MADPCLPMYLCTYVQYLVNLNFNLIFYYSISCALFEGTFLSRPQISWTQIRISWKYFEHRDAVPPFKGVSGFLLTFLSSSFRLQGASQKLRRKEKKTLTWKYFINFPQCKLSTVRQNVGTYVISLNSSFGWKKHANKRLATKLLIFYTYMHVYECMCVGTNRLVKCSKFQCHNSEQNFERKNLFRGRFFLPGWENSC
jgi:hypothetical protein